MRVATTGTPLAIASIRATGMPSILPLGSRIEGSANALASASVARTSSADRAPSSDTRSADPALARPLDYPVALGPVAHELEGDARPALGQQAERVDQVQVALLLEQARHAHDAIGARSPSPRQA